MLDQGLEADLVSDIQKYLEDLISAGTRQQLISLIKVRTFIRIYFTLFLVAYLNMKSLLC